MTRSDAARRGAATAVLWATITFALFACFGEIPALRRAGVIGAAGGVVLDNLRGAGPLIFLSVLAVVSATTGALVGVLAARLRFRPILRIVALALAALPALWLVIAASWMLAWLPRVVSDAPRNLPWMPLGALWFASLGIIVAAPLLAVPAVLAAVLLEGWTRPSTLPQTGVARPIVRRRVLLVLVATGAALTTFAALNWSHADEPNTAPSSRTDPTR